MQRTRAANILYQRRLIGGQQNDENYFAVLDQAGNAAEAAAAEITGYKTYADLLEVGHTPQTVLARHTRRASVSAEPAAAAQQLMFSISAECPLSGVKRT
jgi:hypothetical protein